MSNYKQPKLTVDIIIKCGAGVVLIERKNFPYGWAIPGGFVDYGETVEAAAIREAKEETGLDVKNLKQFHVYSAPSRDPRGHTVSIVFTAEAEGTPKASSDAKDIRIFTQATLPSNIAFDHREILQDYFSKGLGDCNLKMDYFEIFKQIGMRIEGHFELTSGLHSGVYFEKFRLLEHPELTTLICKEIANWCRSDVFSSLQEKDFTTVAGPTTGGIIIAYEVARQLNKRCIFAEKAADGREFRRGFQIKEGEKILVVDDVLTTGGSVLQTIDAIKKRSGIVIGVGVILDRSEHFIEFGVPFFSVCKEKVKNWHPSDCPLCKQGIPLTKPGGK